MNPASLNGHPGQTGSRDFAKGINRDNPAQVVKGFLRWLSASADWRSLAAFALPMAIYLLTMAPTIYNLDSAELTTAAYTGGLMRATGYPLYLSLGMVWSRLPIGDVGFRMNLFSAVCGALTIMLAERILRRWQVGAWATVGALGLLATSTFFWGLSLVAEVYTLHTAIMAGFILALLHWSDSPAPRRMFWVGLLAGLGLSHHAAMTLLAPASLTFILAAYPRKAIAPGTIISAFAGMMLGLVPYLYLPLRYLAQPQFNYAGVYDASLKFHPMDLTTWDGFIWLVTGRTFSGVMLAYRGAELWQEIRAFLVQLGQAFFAIGIGPGLVGLMWLWRRNWREALLLTGMFVFSAGFYINYKVLDKDTMYLPAYLIWALWVGLGSQILINWLRGLGSERLYQNAAWAVQAMLVGGVLLAMIWNWRIVDLSEDWSTRQRGEAILNRAEPGALVFGWWDTVPVVQYLQLVEGKRPDVQAINRFLISSQDLAYAISKEVKVRSVYIDSMPQDLSSVMVAKPSGPVYRLVQRHASGSLPQGRSNFPPPAIEWTDGHTNR